MFDASNSQIDQAAVEIRFSPNWLLWDRAGSIWAATASRFSGVQVLQAQPNNAIFVHPDGQEFKIESDKAAYIEFSPEKELKNFGQHAEQYLDIVASVLGLTELSRVGFRVILFQQYSNLEEASARLRKASRAVGNIPSSLFDVKGPVKDLSLVWRQEAEDVGYRVSMRSENIEFSFDPPIATRRHFKPEKKTESRVVFDIDYYTRLPLSLTQFKCRDWIAQVAKTLRRDAKLIWE